MFDPRGEGSDPGEGSTGLPNQPGLPDVPGPVAAEGPEALASPSSASSSSSTSCEDGEPHDRLARLLAAPPSAEALVDLAGFEIAALSTDDAITFAQVLDRLIGWCEALQDDALVVAAGPEPRIESFQAGSTEVIVADLLLDEIAPALRWSAGYTGSRLAQARLLAGPLAVTRRSVIDGRISPSHARVLCAASERLPSFLDHTPEGRLTFATQCAELQSTVLPVAERGTVAQARRSAERSLIRIDARARREIARRSLGVNVIDEGGGISTLIARMRSIHAHACLAAIDERAADAMLEVPPDAHLGERQAIALASLVLPASPGQGDADQVDSIHRDPIHRGCLRPHLRAHVEVTVSLETMLGMADEPAEFRSRRGVVGVMEAWAVRELLLLSDATTLRRLVTDPMTGHLLDRGRRAYRVPEALRAFLVARDRTCRFPGCMRRADLGEIDHAVAWDAGGTTDRANLGALCKRHHLVKTFGGWQVVDSREDGSCAWHSPGGRRHRRHPVPVGLVRERPPP